MIAQNATQLEVVQLDPTMPLSAYPTLMAISASGGALLADSIHDDVRTRFVAAVAFGYLLGGYGYHDWLYALALTVSFYGGTTLQHRVNRKEHPQPEETEPSETSPAT